MSLSRFGFCCLWCILAARIACAQPATTVAPEVAALLDQAMQARQKQDAPTELRLLGQALEKARAMNDRAGEATALHETGTVYASMRQLDRALESYNQALVLRRLLDDKMRQGQTLAMLGLVYRALNQPQRTLETFNQALLLYQEVKDPASQASLLNELGVTQFQMGKVETALGLHRRALEISDELGDANGQLSAVSAMAYIYGQTGQLELALGFRQQSLKLLRAAGNNKLGEAQTLDEIGLLQQNGGQRELAEANFNAALQLVRDAPDRSGEAKVLTDLGDLYFDSQQLPRALEFYDQALLIRRALGDGGGQAIILARMGVLHERAGRRPQALEKFNEALPLAQNARNPVTEFGILNHIGAIYKDIGQPLKAMELYNQCLRIAQGTNSKSSEATALNNISTVFMDLGQPQRSAEILERVVEIHRNNSDKRSEANALHNLGVAYTDLGNFDKALKILEQLLPMRRAQKDRSGEMVTLNALGVVYNFRKEPGRAVDFFLQALPLARAVGSRDDEVAALSNLSYSEQALGRLDDAEAHTREALGLIEQSREALGALSEARSSFLQSKIFVYHSYIDIQLKRNQPDSAFEWAQKTKARVLLDLMQNQGTDSNDSLSLGERQRQQLLRARAAEAGVQVMNARRQNADDAQLAPLREQLNRAETDLQFFTDTLYSAHPELATKNIATTATLNDVARFLPPDAALLEYVTLQMRDTSRTLLFCVTAENGRAQIKAYPIEQSATQLSARVEKFLAACRNPDAKIESDLYNSLVAPAAAQLEGKTHLIICPDGPLWSLPFQALKIFDSEAAPFLLEKYRISYAFSATAAGAAHDARQNTNRARPTGTLLAMANPQFEAQGGKRGFIVTSRGIIDTSRAAITSQSAPLPPLPGTQVEADALLQNFPDARIYTGAAAQEATAKSEAGKYRYLHFATHGLFNDDAPLLSSIVLADPSNTVAADGAPRDDGFLTARELFDLKLSADLVVLSACDTARGRNRSGEGIVGLTWALFVAGAPSQVVSQWPVSDDSTALLMTKFYGELQRGQAKDAALRDAELALLRDEKHGHPYYWAPFILMGEWR